MIDNYIEYEEGKKNIKLKTLSLINFFNTLFIYCFALYITITIEWSIIKIIMICIFSFNILLSFYISWLKVKKQKGL